jgi:ATP-dependent DNA helicase 2 subunit 2
MAQKEAVLIILDLTHDLFLNGYENLKTMMQITNQLIVQKLLYYSKSDEVSVLLLNSGENANEDNMEIFIDFDGAKLEMVRKIKKFYDMMLQNQEFFKESKNPGDIFKSIEAGVGYFKDRYKDKKYSKKIFMITSGCSPTDYSDQHILHLSYLIAAEKILINIIALDFWRPDRDCTLNQSQKQTKFFLKLMITENEHSIRVFHKELALNILSDYRSKNVSSACKYKGEFELSPFCKLSIVCHRKTVKSNLTGFKKFSKLVPFSKDSKVGEIENQTGFVNPADPQLSFINPQELKRGYDYGQQTIKIDENASNMMKITSERCLKLLGFILENKIPRYYNMSCADCIFANEEQSSQLKAFNSLVLGMINTQKVALARFIPRKNDPPKLVVLYPRKKVTQISDKAIYMLYSLELPTIEDVREYVFGSTMKSNIVQQRLMGELIDRMDIKNFAEGNLDIEEEPSVEPLELLRPSSTFNPIIQVFNQKLLEKGLSNNAAHFNPEEVDPYISEYLNSEVKTHAKVNHLEKAIAENFDLQEHEITEKQQKVFWSKLIEEEEQNAVSNNVMEKLKNKDDDQITKNISLNHPISDFREMINYRKEDLVETAIKQMQAIVLDLVKGSVEGSFYEKAYDCLLVMRDGCVQEEEHELFNNFLINFKEKLLGIKNFKDFWKMLEINSITLITSAECSKSFFSQQEAIDFLTKIASNGTEQKDDAENNDEIFDLVNDLE